MQFGQSVQKRSSCFFFKAVCQVDSSFFVLILIVSMFVYLFVCGSHLACTHCLLLVPCSSVLLGLEGAYVIPRIKPRSVTCKTSRWLHHTISAAPHNDGFSCHNFSTISDEVHLSAVLLRKWREMRHQCLLVMEAICRFPKENWKIQKYPPPKNE